MPCDVCGLVPSECSEKRLTNAWSETKHRIWEERSLEVELRKSRRRAHHDRKVSGPAANPGAYFRGELPPMVERVAKVAEELAEMVTACDCDPRDVRSRMVMCLRFPLAIQDAPRNSRGGAWEH